MKILAIDTSCDDTSVAVVEKKNNQIKTISNIVSSQIKIHAPYGGVYPMLAKRAHQENLVPTLIQSLKKATLLKSVSILADRHRLTQKGKVKELEKNKILNKILEKDEILLEKTVKFLEKYEKPKIDAIAITNTPGLEPCLWQGINFAKALAFGWNLPIIPVNHIKAHLSVNWLTPVGSKSKIKNQKSKQIEFPAIGLVASGGHTELIYMPKQGIFKIIGSTRDDAAGECFDKTARILGLPYPGGPAIAVLAAKKESGIKNQELRVELPRPMLFSNDFDFSFSGLKTAVLYSFQSQKKSIKESQNYKIAMAKEIQQAIIDVLIAKTLKAAFHFNAKSIIAGGGVLANQELRRQFKIKSLKLKIPFFIPEKNLCMDNASMVGTEAIISNLKTTNWQKIKASGNLNI
ncbi:MAG: tRNA (adenosine(37)-N6)-threonylcarbamoyltransferase complex transferase subunit TsaD [Candidatus Pacebacteria bacterium]|nr:tRNA (adenosine(37)-N6)-threonylcarbamoyltransferase complex transferase subunit TsaD [Candidatus Paceibacterota bacterium]